MNNPSLIIFRKELKEAARSRFALLLVIGLAAVIIISIAIAATEFHARVVDYQTYIQSLKAAGGSIANLPPQFFSLQLLRSSVEYLEIVGAIVAVVLGYSLIAKEKNTGALRLLFSRPVSGAELALGKMMAVAVVWGAVLSALGAVIMGSLVAIGGAALSGIEILKIITFLLAGWAYLFTWSAMAIALAGGTKRLSTALIAGLVIWLIIVLVIPQIGDTMDPDNQVPGGLFKSLKVDKSHEKAVLAHFTGYESARNLLEETSVSKRFERTAFAYLGIKEEFNQRSLGYIWNNQWANIAWVAAAAVLAAAAALILNRKKNLLRKE
jgi:ABC-type transport system involved in multi-copper enzyme maturation permease subunit